MDAAEPLHFDCPRCHTDVVEDLYGPCADCRAQLRATVVGAARRVEVADYEPKVNVVANNIAASSRDE